MLTLFGVSMMFTIHPDTAAEVGLLVLFYGLYFGVLGRDFAEICADKMASKLGVSHRGIVLFFSQLKQAGQLSTGCCVLSNYIN
jgi:hypothetical protein